MKENLMSFDKMTVLQLKKIASETGVNVDNANKKVEIIEALNENGVTFDYYSEKFINAEKGESLVNKVVDEVKEQPKVKDVTKSKKTVLRLVSGWSTLQTEWGTATQASPFIMVDSTEVDAATKSGDFKVATPEEVAKAYGIDK